MVKIVDTFIFYNELKMLKFRLTELYDVVDHFVIVESTHTHSGKEKELFFEKNKEDFIKFKDKIIHIVVNDMPNNGYSWDNENHQRICIDRGIKKLNLDKNDIIIITDCDEIPNVKTLSHLKKTGIGEQIYSLHMEMYYYNLECRGKDYIWTHPKLLTYQKYQESNNPQDIRMGPAHGINNGGWHFSYFGDIDFIKNKIQNFAHQEFNNPKYLDNKKIEEQIRNCDDLYFRNNRKMHNFQKFKIEDNQNLPCYYKMLL